MLLMHLDIEVLTVKTCLQHMLNSLRCGLILLKTWVHARVGISSCHIETPAKEGKLSKLTIIKRDRFVQLHLFD
jgi:hypothetical protein